MKRMWEIRIVAGRIGGERLVGERVRPRVWRKDLCFVRRGVEWSVGGVCYISGWMGWNGCGLVG